MIRIFYDKKGHWRAAELAYSSSWMKTEKIPSQYRPFPHCQCRESQRSYPQAQGPSCPVRPPFPPLQ